MTYQGLNKLGNRGDNVSKRLLNERQVAFAWPARPHRFGSHFSLGHSGDTQFGTGSPGRTIRMKWSMNVECISGASDLGMWQLVQFAVALGQILGVAARAPLGE